MTRIGDKIKQTLVDNRVNKSEVEGLINEAKSNGTVSKAEKKELTTLLTKHADKFDSDACSQLASFLDVTPPVLTSTTPAKPAETGLPIAEDPAVLDKHNGQLTFNRIPGGQLFVGGVSFEDVIQGSIGDCYFVGSISAVAYANPQAIQDAIKDNGDGTFTVRLYQKSSSGKLTAKYIRVDDDLPSSGAGYSPKYAKARDSKELWVSILEKAYASLNGGYEKIGNGGFSTDVMTAVTGVRSTYEATKYANANKLFDLIQTGAELKTPMTAGTWGKDANVDYNGTGVYAFHNYSLLGAVEEGGVKYVQLRNPWGSSEHGNDGKNDGIFKMKMEDFMRLYQGININ